MLRIGLTGGIGSGKTLVCQVFSTLGIPVYNSDLRARYLMDNDPAVIDSIKRIFGPCMIKEGQVNRKDLADRVFKERKALDSLNNIVHPAVARDFEAWIKTLGNVGYVIKEAAIIFESGAAGKLDAVISVSAPLELRIQRVMTRDGVSRQKVLERIENQMQQDHMDDLADFVIFNDGSRLLLPQIVALHDKIRRKELFL